MSLILMIVSLPVMSVTFKVGRHYVIAADFLYLVTAALAGVALVRREAALRWHRAYWLLAFYFAAMALSVLFSDEPMRSAAKLATQAYLLSLPVLAYTLLGEEADLRRALTAWALAGGAVGVVGLVVLFLWTLQPGNPLVLAATHAKGTLAEGNYPRLDVSFTHAAMLGNYLTVAISILLVAGKRGWIDTRLRVGLLPAMIVTAFFSLTPGLAGLWLMLGLWYWLDWRGTRPALARAALAAGAVGAAPFLVAAALTPILHPTASFLITLPGIGTLAPAARLLFWIDGWRNLVAHLPFGKGIGTDAIAVPFQNPSGHLYTLTDAHNVYLSVGVQTGLPGLVALVLLISFVARSLLPLPRRLDRDAALPMGLGLAWLSGFAIQGLVGSFEDARFLWLLLGLFLVALDRTAEARR